jgi:hypothetical protein
MKKTIIAFVAGVLAAIALPFVWSIFTYEPTPGETLDSDLFGVESHYGIEAVKSAGVAGIQIPQNATDCYYCIAGLKPVTEFIAYSVPSETLWPEVKRLTGKATASFVTAGAWATDPGSFGPQYKTMLFDLSSTNTVSSVFNIQGNLQGSCFVVPEDNRILICIMSD